MAAQALAFFSSCRKKEEAVLVDTTAAKYNVGEKWNFRSRPGEDEATLTVVKVETTAKIGTIIHVSIQGVRIKSPHAPTGFSDTIAHMPFSESAIEKSVTRLVAKDVPLPKFEEGYREWRAAFEDGKGGVFSITVGEGIDFVETALNR